MSLLVYSICMGEAHIASNGCWKLAEQFEETGDFRIVETIRSLSGLPPYQLRAIMNDEAEDMIRKTAAGALYEQEQVRFRAA